MFTLRSIWLWTRYALQWLIKPPVAIIVALGLLCVAMPALGRDQGQWQYQDPSVSDYFASLKQPDNPFISCCGNADAYFADLTATGPNGETIAIITDTRDDGPLLRQHIEVGTQILVPPNKVRKHPAYNPTGHTLIFVGAGSVYCYEPLPLI